MERTQEMKDESTETERALIEPSERFERLLGLVRSRVNAHALMLTRNPVDAEDLLQTAILRAWTRFDSFDHNRSFGKWLSVILMHSFLDKRRAEGRRVRTISYESTPTSAEGDAYILEFCEIGPSLEDRLTERHQFDLEHALENLPEAHRRIVLLCDMLGYDYHDCAEREGVPLGTVRSRLFRGRQKLRTILENGSDSGLMAA